MYVLLIGMLVLERAGWVRSARRARHVRLYLGAASAMASAWFFSRVLGCRNTWLAFYTGCPATGCRGCGTQLISGVGRPLRVPRQGVTSIILLTTVVLWTLLNLPLRGDAELAAAGVDPTDDVAVTAFVLDNSAAAAVGRAVAPVFDPLGFDWRVNVGVISLLAAREVFAPDARPDGVGRRSGGPRGGARRHDRTAPLARTRASPSSPRRRSRP